MSNMRGTKSGSVEVFLAEGKRYSKEGYEKCGDRVSPYNNVEIEFD